MAEKKVLFVTGARRGMGVDIALPGYGTVDGVPVYVTNGAGFWGPPVRIGAPPQVTFIEIRTP
jgi:predicted MPP superfamily phosphohydrolase